MFVFKSVIFQLIYFSSSAFYRTFLCNYLFLPLSLPLSQVCRSYLHVAAHDSQWRRHLRCFELPQTVSLPSCLCMSLCICLIDSPVLSFNLPSCFFSVFVCFLRLSVLSACFICVFLLFTYSVNPFSLLISVCLARPITHSLTHSLVLSLVLRLYKCLSIFQSFLFFSLYPSVKYSVSVSMSACFFFLSFSRFVCIQVSNISTNLYQ